MSIPTLDEQFLPRLLAIFYAVFHPTEGPKVIYQVPEGSITSEHTPSKPDPPSSNATASSSRAQPDTLSEPLFDFSALSEYLIPKAPLCGRLVTSIARGTVGVRRREHAPSRAPSAGRRSASARSSSSRASSLKPKGDGDDEKQPQREQRSYKILGFPTLIEDNAKYQRNNFIFNLCFVFEGSSDVRAYEPVVRKCGRVLRDLEETKSFLSSPKSLPRMYGIIEQLFEDLSSYCESFVALPEAPYTSYLSGSKPSSPEVQNLISPVLGPEDFISLGASFASLKGQHHRELINERLKQKQQKEKQKGEGTRSRASSGTGSQDNGRIGPMTSITRGEMVRSSSASGTSGPGSDGPHSPSSQTGTEGRRPSLGRSSTITAVLSDEAEAEGNKDTAMGIVSTSRRLSDRELSAAESLGNVLTGYDTGAYDSVNTSSGTRRSSRGSTTQAGEESMSLEQLTESIVSLRTIDAALSNSNNALRTEVGDSSKRTALVERREPPHGLGRTVRDAINLKLFPVYPNPPPIQDWDVPVALLDLLSRVDGNWDLTLRRILPFIDGVNHVKRIAQLADADLGLTRAALEHLLYYACIITVDIFQYWNMYTVRPAIATISDDVALGKECCTYVTRQGWKEPSYPEVLKLYSLLRAGTTLNDWVEDNEIDAKGIDVRRFVQFGVIQGFLRRIHRYPIYLGARGDAEAGGSEFDISGTGQTVRNSPVINSESSAFRRDQSGSREARDRRPRELSGMSGAYSAFQRIGRDGSVDSPGVGTRTPTRRGVSEARLSSVVPSSTADGSAGGSAFGTSPTKRLQRRGVKPNYRHPTTTAMDVASVAFANDTDRPPTTARSPRKRASAIGLPSTQASSSGFAHPHTPPIPPGLVEMLDGLHSEDELCTLFGVSWPELERMLVAIGHVQGGVEEEDESGWRRWPGGSGWSSKGRGSGYSGIGGMRGGMSGVASSGGGQQSKGEESGWGAGLDGDESGLGWVHGREGVDREKIENGDLGRVRILYQ